MAAKATSTKGVTPNLKILDLSLIIVGDTPFISHAWSAKAKGMMRDKYQKTAKSVSPREARNPEQEFRDSMYIVEEKTPFEASLFGFPALGFKASAINAISTIPGITKVMAKQVFHINGVRVGDYELVPVFSDTLVRCREDMVRNVSGTTDMRYRGELQGWYCKLNLRYNDGALSEKQIIAIFNSAGFGSGIGEWRPSTNGNNGMYHVAEGDEAKIYAEKMRTNRMRYNIFGG